MSNNTPELTDAAAPEPAGTTLESTEAAPEPELTEATPGDKAAREAAKYRRRLREVEAERDRLAAQLEAFQRGEIARLAYENYNVKGEALWAAGYTVADLVDADGRPDENKVREAANATAEKFGIRQLSNYVPLAGTIPKPPISITWSELLDPYKQ